MMKLSLEQKIYIGFGLALLTLSTIGITSYLSMNRLVEADKWEEQTASVLVKFETLLSELKDVGGTGYIITGDERYLEPHYKALEQIDQEIEVLRRLTAADLQLQRHLDIIESLIQRKLALAQQLIETRQNEGFEAAVRLVETDEDKRILDAIRQEIGEIKAEQVIQLQQRTAQEEAEVRQATIIINLSSLLAVIIVVVAIFVIKHDLTQRKRLEEAAQESEARYSTMFRDNHTATLLLNPETGDIVDANPAACAFYGYSHQEITGMKIGNINQTPPKELSRILQEIKLAKRKTYEFKYRLASGAIVDVEVYTGPIKLGNRELLYSIAYDITERKQMEAALKENEALFRATFQEAPISIGLTNMQGDMLASNLALQKMLGYSPEELHSMTVAEVTNPADADESAKLFQELISGERQSYQVEKRYRHKNGQVVWGRVTASLVRDQQERPLFVVGMIEDISERKRAEEELHKLSRAVEQSASIVVITDTQGYIEYANPQFAKTTGYTLEEAIGQHTRILKSGHTSPAEYEQLWQTITAGKEWRGEFCNKKKNGELYWEAASLSPIKNAQGVITNFLAVKEDITERKQAEEELRLTKLVVEHSQAVLFRWRYAAEEGWPVEFVSRNVSQFGYTPEEFLTTSLPYTSIVLPEDVARIDQEIEAYFVNGIDNYRLEYRIITKDGQIRWVDDRTVVERDAEGRVTHTQGLVLDITERKQFEEALAKERNLMRTLIDNLPDLIFVKDMECRFVLVNRASLNNGQITMADIIGKTDFEINPELAAQYYADDQAVIQSGQAILNREEPNMGTGQVRWFSTTKVPLRNNQEQIIGLVGMSRDIH
jgi:PAS domain S-box-containing protein